MKWNSSEIDPHIFAQLTFNTRAKAKGEPRHPHLPGHI